MAQDPLQRAKECFADVKEAWRENHQRMLDDLRFSNPVDPQQWDKTAKDARAGRVCLTLDRTNQYIVQVVNNARMNKPSITTMPADSRADVAVAKALDGIVRHIEYRSRAQIAYDWAMEGAARCGVGWLRVVPRVMDPATNQQEICIDRVADHLSIVIDGDQPDGSDAMNGFASTLIPKKRFERQYGKKASKQSWDGEDAITWETEDQVRICEWQYVEETKQKMLVLLAPDGGEIQVSEEDYRELSARVGFEPPIDRTFDAVKRTVHWRKFSGAEMLEETTLPGNYIGMVPVIGFELFLEGKRYLSGLTRRLMESQKAYNYERSAGIETVALQPKAPVLVPMESIEGHEEHWQKLNTGQPAYLPYNALDGDGKPLPPPQRLAPPAFPNAFAQGGQLAVADMEAAVGMYQAVLGQPNNATSGKQERERRQQGSVATYHFADNQARSIEHLGRIVVGMVPAIYDTKRQAKILGIDGQQSSVEIDPDLQVPAVKRGAKVVAINPTVGQYDVRVKTGPSYTSQREEAAEGISLILQAAPDFAPVLVPELARMRDWPGADKIARALTAMAPPQVQQILGEDENSEEEPIPPAAMAQMQQQGAQIQQMEQMLDAAEKELQKADGEKQAAEAETRKLQIALQQAKLDLAIEQQKVDVDFANAETARLKVLAEAEAREAQLAQEAIQAQRDAEREASEGAEALRKVADLQQVLADMAKEQATAEQLRQVQEKAQEAAAAVAEEVKGSEVVSVEKVRDADGQMIAARLTHADGSVREVSIQ